MSKHHHHPHEGHGSGNPPGNKPRHNLFFYIAGFFIFIALLCFIFAGSFAGRPAAVAPTVPADSATK